MSLEGNNRKSLLLVIKEEYFEMIRKNIKPEEYREIKPYYASRILNLKSFSRLKGNLSIFRGYLINSILEELKSEDLKEANECLQRVLNKNIDSLLLRNGYSSRSPMLLIELNGVNIGEGKKEWGAVEGERYFILKLGKIIETKNLKNE